MVDCVLCVFNVCVYMCDCMCVRYVYLVYGCCVCCVYLVYAFMCVFCGYVAVFLSRI